MTELAVAIAVAAAVLALVLLIVVVRQSRAVQQLSHDLDDTRAALTTIREQGEQLFALQQETSRALELALTAPPGTGPAADTDDSDDVTVITDISDRLRRGAGSTAGQDDELTTARIASVTLGGPLIKVAAFGHGVRHALDEEQRLRISYAVRKELRRQRKMRRRRRTDQAPSRGWG
jgi:hypothetical protein